MTLHHLTEPLEARLAGNIRRLDAVKAELRALEDAILRDGRAYLDARGEFGAVRVERLRLELGV